MDPTSFGLRRPRDLERTRLGGGPDADYRVAGRGGRDRLVVAGQGRLRHLQDDRVDVVDGEVVLAAAPVAGGDARAEVDRVERLAEVDEERIVAWPGEHLPATVQRPDRLIR